MKSLKAINSLLAIGVILGLAACGSGGGGTAGGSTGTGTGTGTGGGGGVTTDNDTPPTNAQLDGDTVTVTFDGGFTTPGGATQIQFVYNQAGSEATTDNVSGDSILTGYGTAFGNVGFDIVNTTASTYQYSINPIIFTDGLNATFTGTYDADQLDAGNALVAVTGTITIVE
jgi:hypothetical protein